MVTAFLRRILAGAALVLCVAASAGATVIEYEIFDLTDSVVGEDLWEYRYHVSGQSFPTNYGFDIFFLLSNQFTFGDMEVTPLAPNADWDVISIQADPNLPHDGRYDALALVDNASLVDPFSLSFIWRDSGTPASQPFEIFDDTFAVIEQGMTIPYVRDPANTVPEPGTIVLLGVGIAGVLVGNKVRSRS
ncbi:MAG: PEP-CTERM sorting domain-containing protein [Desulfuromonadales bacterium]|nr:MAG: PEP-CTERM sorting domain-containing protein [Desulfuromonadales bacterium]